MSTVWNGARDVSRRTLLAGAGALAGAQIFSGLKTPALAQANPLKIGLQAHRTGIGAVYGYWYERTSRAAVSALNDMGGIGGRPVELIVEDDATDAKRASEIMDKFATQHQVDLVFGPLFGNVVNPSVARAAELKMPLFLVSETSDLADGLHNRYTFQTGITTVKSQIKAVAPWIFSNLGKKVAMILPDYNFGYEHRDNFSKAAQEQGAEVNAVIAIPPTETTFTKYLSQVPSDADVIYHVLVGPGVLTFVRELGEYFGSGGPKLFGFIDSLESIDLAAPGLEFLDGSHLWEALPRNLDGLDTEGNRFYRDAVGLDENGASKDNAKDISANSHMYGCWETLFSIKQGMEASGYKENTAQDKAAFIEAMEKITSFHEGKEFPQGSMIFNGATHQSFGRQFISQVVEQKLKVVHTVPAEETVYETKTDYTKMAL